MGGSKRARVAVVGAGPGGLSAALMLARAGVEVTVFEKAGQVGGRTRTIEAPGGYRFDLGPTFFLYPRVLREIFAACDADLDRMVELKRLDPLYKLIFESGGELRASADPERLQQDVAALSPHDAGRIQAYLADNRRKLTAFRPILERPFTKLTDFLAPDVLASLGKLRPFTSVDQDLRRHFDDPRVRLAFSFQSKYLGMSPFRCPSLFTILSFLEHEHGIFHPMGGCGAVSEAMKTLAERMGVRFMLGTDVDHIEYRSDKPVAVHAKGSRHEADSVVIGADFVGNIRKIVPERYRARWSDAKIERARLSCSTLMFYLGIEGGVDGLDHHTILLAEDYERNIKEIEDGILPMQPSIYVQHAGFTDPGMAPPGHTSLYVLVPVPNLRAGIDWPAVLPSYRQHVFERLRRMGLEDLERRIRFERVVTPQQWQAEYAVGQGATFNLAHDLLQMLWFRPHNRLAPGTYLVGGGTHPGSGLPVIFEGARITTKLLLDDLGIDHARMPILDEAPLADAGEPKAEAAA
ncbi:MAG TPA: phytoene desaturase family protein [Geminicoccus sp.]|jgi:phytoene desaturase|uniref:phytoene desaturase family protein n=1 Tax=Geminicoccus sp. TaxID=2024832 RepID=UPI002E36F541|nr:phytoene desaturase family protein [Geminicoccus sp.]HEX2528884.1 phytoene desaturase family protein [Geminicoccus sp.]